MKRLSLLCLATAALLLCTPAFVAKTYALSGSDFQAGHIIDDAVFNNSSSMDVGQIQQFLNSKVACDTWGTQTSELGGGTRAQYGTAHGNPPPYTCLNGYYENINTFDNNLDGRPIPAGAESAAQIIHDAAAQYGVNPQVLIVLIQREQGLVTDQWPFDVQYQSATGYACPDVGPNHSIVCLGYFGFYNQVVSAAWQFQHYAQNPNSFNYIPNANNFIQWSPQPTCGGSNVFIQNQATASLYDYAPYQPNAAALANLYGTGDACSSYANRNFWRYFNDWFGSTLIYDPFGWSVITTPSDGRWFLIIGNTKRYIPTSDIYYDWQLDAKPVQTVSQAYADSIPTVPNLGRLGWVWGRYYYVDNKKKYWLSTDELMKAWGQYDLRGIAAPAITVLSKMQDGGTATYFASQSTEGTTSFLANGTRYPLSDPATWRANPVPLTQSDYDNLPNGGTVGNNVSINNLKFLVDAGRLLDITNPVLLSAYNQTGATFTNIPGSVVNFISSQQAVPMVTTPGQGWYGLVKGTKYYVPNMATARTWGLGNTPTVVSPGLFNSLATSSTSLSAIVHDANTDTYYLVDDIVKHRLTGSLKDGVQGGNTIPDIDVSDTGFSSMATGSDISSPLLRNQDVGHVYNVMNGSLYHIPTVDILHAYGWPRKFGLANISADAAWGLAPSFVDANMFVASGSTTYFLQDGNAFPISSSSLPDWRGSLTPPTYASPNFSARFDISGTSYTQQISQLGHNMIASNGTMVDVGRFNDAYDNGASWTGLVTFGLPSTQGTFLARSSDNADNRVWLINRGQKEWLTNGDQLFAYSGAGRVPLTTLSPTALNLYSTGANGPSLLVYSTAGGFKMLENDGSYFSFADGDALNNFVGSNSTENLSPSVYNNYNFDRGTITRLICDTSTGKVYWVQGGQKHWILGLSVLNRYSNTTQLTNVGPGIANWLPDGSAITN